MNAMAVLAQREAGAVCEAAQNIRLYTGKKEESALDLLDLLVGNFCDHLVPFFKVIQKKAFAALFDPKTATRVVLAGDHLKEAYAFAEEAYVLLSASADEEGAAGLRDRLDDSHTQLQSLRTELDRDWPLPDVAKQGRARRDLAAGRSRTLREILDGRCGSRPAGG